MCDKLKQIEKFIITIANNENFKDAQVIIKEFSGKNGLISDILTAKLISANKDDVKMVIKASPSLKSFREQLLVRENYLNEIYFYGMLKPIFDKCLETKLFPDCFGICSKPLQEIVILEDLAEYSGLNAKNITEYEIGLVLDLFGKFHAVSYMHKSKNRRDFLKITDESYGNLHKFFQKTKFTQSVEEQCDKIAHLFQGDVLKRFKCFRNDMKNIMDNYKRYHDEYSVIIHGDAWVNNIMVKYEETEPVDLRLIDFQATRIGSIVQDISYFLYTCLNETQLQNIRYYMKMYYDSFSLHMNKLGCDPVKLYPFSVFESHWKKFASYGLAMCIVVMHGMCSAPGEFPDIYKIAEDGGNVFQALNYTSKNEKIYEQKIKCVVEHFAKEKFI